MLKKGSSLIDSFIFGITQKRMNMEVSLPRVRDKLRHISYTNEFHRIILKLDLYTYNNHMGFKDAEFHKKNIKIDFAQLIVYRFAIPYITEKLIITLDNKSEKAEKPNILLIDTLKDAYLAAGSIKPSGNKNIFEKLSFLYGYDQIKLQQNNRATINLIRLIELYKSTKEVDNYIKTTVGLSLEKLCILMWVLYRFISESKKVYVYFSIENFRKYALVGTFNSDEIDSFLKLILISLKDFKKEYERIRTDINTGKLFDDEKLKQIDQFLPKISFWYPLIKQSEEIMFLVSYTALQQSLELERIYDLIYKCTIPNFKSKIHGPAFENYVKQFIKERTDAKIYGNERYKIKKSITYDEPDVIVEFDDYVVFIECKSKPFNLLEAIQKFDDYEFDKIKDEYKLSNTNIDRYLEHRNNFSNKKIYRIMVYLFSESVCLSSVVPPPISSDMLITTDIRSLEMLFSIKDMGKDMGVDKILDEYCNLVQKNEVTSLNSLLELTYYDKVNDDIEDKKFRDILKNFLLEK